MEIPDKSDNSHFDNWAPKYESSIVQKLFFDPIHNKMIREILNSGIDSPSDILDAGCGTGRLLRSLSKRFPKAKLSGIDVSETMIKVAKNIAPGINFEIAPAEYLPFEDNVFDTVVSSLTMHHWNNAEQGIQEIQRVLKPGGIFCLADHIGPKWAVRFFGPGAKSNRELAAIFQKLGFRQISKDWFFGWVGIRVVRNLK